MTKDVNVGHIPDDIEIIQNKATMCDNIIYNDAEAQCDSIPKKSIAVETLAQRKSRKQKRKAKQSHKTICQTPVRAYKESIVEPKKLFSREVEEQQNIEQIGQDDDIPDDIDGLDVSDDDDDYAGEDDLSFDEDDEDYVYSESGESSDEDVQTLVNERKFIVFESMLDQLFISCKECGSLCEIQKTRTGSMVTIKTVCCNNHIFKWKSQPELHKKPAGNILIPSAIVFTGGTYEATKQISQHST